MQTDFQGTWIPIVTPFHDDPRNGSTIDHAALAALARHLAGQGIAGFIAGATTGEGALLTPGEIDAIHATLRTAVPSLPIVLGVSQSATAAAVADARRLAALGIDGLLVTAPPYLRPSQDGIRRHLEAVALAADCPVLIYDIPYRTGAQIAFETLARLATDPRIVGIKACGCSDDHLLRLIHETPLRVLAGDDHQNFVALCLGAHGTIAASAHVLTDWHVRMRDHLLRGDVVAARHIAVALQPLVRHLFAEPNPAPLKALLATLGFGSASVRPPFEPASPALVATLRRQVEQLRAQGV